jgi:hypothetical protein
MIKLTEYANINTSEIEIAGKSYYYDNSLYNNGQTLAWSIRNNEPDTIKSIEHVFDLCEHIFKVGDVYFVSPNFIFIQDKNSGLDFKIFFTNKKITKIRIVRILTLQTETNDELLSQEYGKQRSSSQDMNRFPVALEHNVNLKFDDDYLIENLTYGHIKPMINAINSIKLDPPKPTFTV